MRLEELVKDYASTFYFGMDWIQSVEVLMNIWSKEPFVYPSTWECYRTTLRLNELHSRIDGNSRVDRWFIIYSAQINLLLSNICLEYQKDRKGRKEPSKELIDKIEELKINLETLDKLVLEQAAFS